ncbi:MAG: glycosyltransferase family 2 protein [Hyphomicrobiales bacterium]
MSDVNAVPILIVVPCLNEASHIAELISSLCTQAADLRVQIVIADGGSSDGTRELVQRIAASNNKIVLLDNPKRLQSAALNLAVKELGQNCRYMIRIDAHGAYPTDYCRTLIAEAEDKGADSVVVSMRTVGTNGVSDAAAAVQNSHLGNGGSKHRKKSHGQWIDHGHHALMRIDAFEAVGGYDELFSHNEDAELDYRLGTAGYRIWLTSKTEMTYYPRSSLSALFSQYLNYGKGRARNLLKHRVWPKVRQSLPLLVFPAVIFMALQPILGALSVLPAAVWLSVCIGYGVAFAIRTSQPKLLLAGVSAIVMHFAWSLGFWLQLVSYRREGVSAA